MSITTMKHPGTMTDAQLGDLADLAGVMSRKSGRFAELLAGWIERERARREPSDEPTEPELLKIALAKWSDAEIADAMVAAHVAMQASEDSSEGVKALIGRMSFVITCWAAHRLADPERATPA